MCEKNVDFFNIKCYDRYTNYWDLNIKKELGFRMSENKLLRRIRKGSSGMFKMF